MDFLRISVDVDPLGGVKGWSAEARSFDQTVHGILCRPCGPFDDPRDALEEALAAAMEHWGHQGALF